MAGMFDPQINSTTAQSLFDIMGPGSAGQYLGSQQMMQEQMNDVNQNLSLADLDKIQLSNQHDRTMNPMKEQVQRSLVREADSKTPEYFTGMRQGELGTARSLVAKAKLDEDTLAGNISAKNSSNSTAIIQDMGKNMLNMLTYVGGLPGGPAEQRKAMQQLIASHGFDKDPASHAIWNQLLNSPDMVKQGTDLATRMMNLNPQYLAELTKGREHNQTLKEVGAGHDSATRYAADAKKRSDDAEKEKFKREWMKASDERKANWLRQLAMTSSDGMVETPLGTVPVGAALTEAKRLEDQVIKAKQAAAKLGDDRTRTLINMPPAGTPNGNGTGGEVAAPKTYDPATKTWK